MTLTKASRVLSETRPKPGLRAHPLRPLELDRMIRSRRRLLSMVKPGLTGTVCERAARWFAFYSEKLFTFIMINVKSSCGLARPSAGRGGLRRASRARHGGRLRVQMERT